MKNLRKLREEAHVSQAALARALGVAQNTVSNWENGNRDPSNEALMRVADFFGVTVDYLLGKEESKREDPGIDDFTYALYGEVKGLGEADREMLLQMARMLKKRQEGQHHS